MFDPILDVLKKIKLIDDKEKKERKIETPYKLEPDQQQNLNTKSSNDVSSFIEVQKKLIRLTNDVEMLKSEIRRLSRLIK